MEAISGMIHMCNRAVMRDLSKPLCAKILFNKCHRDESQDAMRRTKQTTCVCTVYSNQARVCDVHSQIIACGSLMQRQRPLMDAAEWTSLALERRLCSLKLCTVVIARRIALCAFSAGIVLYAHCNIFFLSKEPQKSFS